MPTFDALSQAIAREENSQWPNNPGAIEDTSGVPIDFGSPAVGMAALQKKLEFDASGKSSIYDPSMSLSDFEHTYTGGDPNAGNNVASILGVSPSTPLSSLSDQALSSSSNQSWWNKFKDFAMGSPQGTLDAQMNAAKAESSAGANVIGWLLSSRLVIGLLGIICIAVGLMMFKTTGVVIQTATKAGVKAAELAA